MISWFIETFRVQLPCMLLLARARLRPGDKKYCTVLCYSIYTPCYQDQLHNKRNNTNSRRELPVDTYSVSLKMDCLFWEKLEKG
ncbi:hypothetical protein P3L10_032988 [Capsicum annuum]